MWSMSGVELEAFADGYIEGVAWANVINEDWSDSNLDGVELPTDVEETLRQDARDFLAGEHIEAFVRAAVRRLPGYSFESAGIDYALTRNGHGAGYWDRGLGMLGEALTQLAKPYGSRYLMVSLDGTIQAGE
jgi:hypothetical protein